jgi:hypothetical protein
LRRNDRNRPTVRVGAVQVPAFEDPNEEILGQVLGLHLRVAAAAHVGINGIPVVLAQTHQGIAAILTQRIAGGDHEGPTGFGKIVAADLCVRCHGAVPLT